MAIYYSTAIQQILPAHIARLDYQISKLSSLFNSQLFKSGSLMISGRNPLNRDFHELLIWDSQNRIPKYNLKKFLQLYAEDLIMQQQRLKEILTAGQIELEIETRTAHCPNCCNETTQTNYYNLISKGAGLSIPTDPGTWYCNNCETIINP